MEERIGGTIHEGREAIPEDTCSHILLLLCLLFIFALYLF